MSLVYSRGAHPVFLPWTSFLRVRNGDHGIFGISVYRYSMVAYFCQYAHYFVPFWRFTGIVVVYPKSIPLGHSTQELEDLLLISPSPAAQNHLLSMFAEFVAPMGSNLLSATVGNSRQCFRTHSPLDSSAHAIKIA